MRKKSLQGNRDNKTVEHLQVGRRADSDGEVGEASG